jgi:hypothetical protein
MEGRKHTMHGCQPPAKFFAGPLRIRIGRATHAAEAPAQAQAAGSGHKIVRA